MKLVCCYSPSPKYLQSCKFFSQSNIETITPKNQIEVIQPRVILALVDYYLFAYVFCALSYATALLRDALTILHLLPCFISDPPRHSKRSTGIALAWEVSDSVDAACYAEEASDSESWGVKDEIVVDSRRAAPACLLSRDEHSS